MPDFNFLTLGLGALLGAVTGSFLNMLCHRLPIMLGMNESVQSLNLFVPRSHCPRCQTPLSVWHNLPIVSYLILKGKCAFCRNSIGVQYLLLELVAMILGIVFAMGYHFTPLVLTFVIPVILALAIAVIDYRTLYIPDELSYCLLWSGLLVNASTDYAIIPLDQSIWGAVIGYLSLWSIHHLYALIRKKEGLGYGDFKLFAAWGAWFGALSLPSLMLVAACSALTFILYGRLKQGTLDWHKPFAFGPWLVCSGLIHILLFFIQQ